MQPDLIGAGINRHPAVALLAFEDVGDPFADALPLLLLLGRELVFQLCPVSVCEPPEAASSVGGQPPPFNRHLGGLDLGLMVIWNFIGGPSPRWGDRR
jgi:hypothetical protein